MLPARISESLRRFVRMADRPVAGRAVAGRAVAGRAVAGRAVAGRAVASRALAGRAVAGLVLAVAAASAASAASVQGGANPPTQRSTPAPSSTAALQTDVWDDEFSGAPGAPPDPLNWEAVSGDWTGGDNELEYYTSSPSNVELDGAGHLAITVRRQNLVDGKGRLWRYTSARIDTYQLFQTEYGRIEARIKLPAGQGLWPAFWALSTDIYTEGWPAAGEIDMMESLGGNTHRTYSALHGPAASGRGGLQNVMSARSAQSLSMGFHVYGMDWSPSRIVFTLDGMPYAVRTPSSFGQTSWVFDHPFFLILNVAVGGAWGGPPAPSTRFPATMLVDWVRVYR
jgi:beta-glucanase (GH16 family)